MLQKAVIFCKSSLKILFFPLTTGFYDNHEVLSCVAPHTQMHPPDVNEPYQGPDLVKAVDSLSLRFFRFFCLQKSQRCSACYASSALQNIRHATFYCRGWKRLRVGISMKLTSRPKQIQKQQTRVLTIRQIR